MRLRLGPASLADGPMPKPVFAGGLHFVLVRDGDRLVAAERACPHEGADLALGYCAAGRLHCPRHQVSFDLANGAVPPGWFFRALQIFSVETVDNTVWLISRNSK